MNFLWNSSIDNIKDGISVQSLLLYWKDIFYECMGTGECYVNLSLSVHSYLPVKSSNTNSMYIIYKYTCRLLQVTSGKEWIKPEYNWDVTCCCYTYTVSSNPLCRKGDQYDQELIIRIMGSWYDTAASSLLCVTWQDTCYFCSFLPVLVHSNSYVRMVHVCINAVGSPSQSRFHSTDVPTLKSAHNHLEWDKINN